MKHTMRCRNCDFIMSNYVAAEAGGGCPMCGAPRNQLEPVEYKMGPRGPEREQSLTDHTRYTRR